MSVKIKKIYFAMCPRCGIYDEVNPAGYGEQRERRLGCRHCGRKFFPGSKRDSGLLSIAVKLVDLVGLSVNFASELTGIGDSTIRKAIVRKNRTQEAAIDE